MISQLMIKIKPKKVGEQIIYMPYFSIDGKDTEITGLQSFTIKADVANDFGLPQIQLDLQKVSNDSFQINVENELLRKASLKLDGKEYELCGLSFLRYIDIITGIRHIWKTLTKEQQDQFIKDATTYGNYGTLRAYMEA